MLFIVRFFKDLGLGVKSCIKAFKFVFDHGFWPYFVATGVVAGILIWVGLLNSDGVMNYHVSSSARESLPELTLEVAIWLLKLLMLLMTLSLNKYIILLILPPLLGRASERTERLLTGNTYKFIWPRFLEDMRRSVRITINNFLWEAGLILVGMIILLVIGAPEIVGNIYVFVAGLYFYGFSMMDYTLERMRMSADDSKKFIRKHAGLAVGVGLFYSSLITFVMLDFGWFVEAGDGILHDLKIYFGVIFAPIICVVAATMGVHQLVDLNTNQHAIKGDAPEEVAEEA